MLLRFGIILLESDAKVEDLGRNHQIGWHNLIVIICMIFNLAFGEVEP